MAEQKKKEPEAGCHIVEIVMAGRARRIVQAFKDGSNTRQIARTYGLSRSGVEELIRSYGWSRKARRAVAARA